MNTSSSVLLTGVIVASGQWARDKKLSMRYFIGIGVFAIGLASLGEVNDQLARQFGVLMVVAALLLYGPTIANSLGLTR